jgi:hypothetical protein
MGRINDFSRILTSPQSGQDNGISPKQRTSVICVCTFIFLFLQKCVGRLFLEEDLVFVDRGGRGASHKNLCLFLVDYRLSKHISRHSLNSQGL